MGDLLSREERQLLRLQDAHSVNSESCAVRSGFHSSSFIVQQNDVATRGRCHSPPPPMIVMHPVPVSSASVVAMPLVPLANASNSNTPMGPFQITTQNKTREGGMEEIRVGARGAGLEGGLMDKGRSRHDEDGERGGG